MAGLFLLLGLVISVTAWQMFLLPREAEAAGAVNAPLLLLARSGGAGTSASAGNPDIRPVRHGAVKSVPSRLLHPGTVAEPASEVPDAEASRRNRLYEFIPLPEPVEPEPVFPESVPGEPVRMENREAGSGPAVPRARRSVPSYASIDSLQAAAADDLAAPVEPAGGEPSRLPAPGPARAEQEASPESGGLQVVVLGPPVGRVGDLMTFSILIEDSSDVAHAPLRVQFDPDVLEYVIAREGPFFSSDGASTHFFAMQGGIPGQVDLALSRVPPARGLSGNGTLCELTFRAVGEGESPVVLAGSRLLDPAGYPLAFRRNDIYVAVQ